MNPLFQTHVLNPDGIEKAKRLGALFDKLVADIEALTPMAGRELALCHTKLEEACFFAKKAIAKNAAHQG